MEWYFNNVLVLNKVMNMWNNIPMSLLVLCLKCALTVAFFFRPLLSRIIAGQMECGLSCRRAYRSGEGSSLFDNDTDLLC